MPFLDTTNRLEPEYDEPFQAWKRAPSKANATRLLKAVEPEIQRGISAHVGKSNPLLHSRARRLTLKALPTYDPQQSKLGTFLVNQLQGLKRINRQQTTILRVPERVAIEKGQLERSTAELTEELGREPSTAELADYTGLSIRRINYVHRFQPPVSEGFLASLSQGEEGGDVLPAVEQPQSDSWAELVYGDLDPINQKVMEWTLGLRGAPPLSNLEIARRLRLSPWAISQRKAHIQALLNQRDELSLF